MIISNEDNVKRFGSFLAYTVRSISNLSLSKPTANRKHNREKDQTRKFTNLNLDM